MSKFSIEPKTLFNAFVGMTRDNRKENGKSLGFDRMQTDLATVVMKAYAKDPLIGISDVQSVVREVDSILKGLRKDKAEHEDC